MTEGVYESALADTKASLEHIKKRRDGNSVWGSTLQNTVTAQDTV